MKAFARWLFMKTHEEDLLTVANFIRRDISGLAPKVGLVEVGKVKGAIYTLETLDLLVRS